VFSEFVSENVDKVELIYTRFVSLIASRPVVQTLLPLAASGQVCTVNGVCVDAKDDEVFALTSEDGKFAVKREAAPVDTSGAVFDGVITFEQDPNQILDALLPLYMNSQVLRALQESIASELAARMTAMGAASDNAKQLSKALNLSYNRQRQARFLRCAGGLWLRAVQRTGCLWLRRRGATGGLRRRRRGGRAADVCVLTRPTRVFRRQQAKITGEIIELVSGSSAV
jgi:F0F1-type ATP synthase gamma subunit